jgi:phosphopantetheinyl transferase (holo-ACP synthase)
MNDISHNVDRYIESRIDEVSIYKYNLDDEKDISIMSSAILSNDEISRASKFRYKYLSGLIDHCCTSHEIEYLKSLNTIELRSAFYRIWTAKEAQLKKLVVGFTVELKELNVIVNNSKIIEWTYNNSQSSQIFSINILDNDYTCRIFMHCKPLLLQNE